MNFKNTVQTAKRVLVACGLMGSLAAGTPARPQATPSQSTAPVARVTQLLAECSYQYTKAAEAVWVVPFQEKSLGSFKVIVTTQQGMLVVFVIVASKSCTRSTRSIPCGAAPGADHPPIPQEGHRLSTGISSGAWRASTRLHKRVEQLIEGAADLNLTPDAMEKLLKLNHRVDRVKSSLVREFALDQHLWWLTRGSNPRTRESRSSEITFPSHHLVG